MMTGAVPVKLTDEQQSQVKALMKATGRDRSKVIRAALRYFLRHVTDPDVVQKLIIAESDEVATQSETVVAMKSALDTARDVARDKTRRSSKRDVSQTSPPEPS